MKPEPTAASLVREGLAPMIDACGVVLLGVLGWQVMFGGSQPFETHAVWLGVIGTIACWVAPGAIRNVPWPLLAYAGVALLSAAVHRWPVVAAASKPDWLSLFTPAVHLVTMAVFVYGAAHFFRKPWRLSVFTVLLVASIGILAVQILFDRAMTNFVYDRNGSVSLPSVAQWGGLHQTGMLLVLALPFPLAMALIGRSASRVLAGLLLAGGLLAVGPINGSRGGVVAMIVTGVIMSICAVAKRVGVRWRSRALWSVVPVVAIGLAVVLLVRINSLAGGLKNIGDRLSIWEAAVRIWLDHLWLGVGPGNYQTAMLDGGYARTYLPAGSGGAEQAHNLLLHVGAETGAIGVLCLLALWVWMFKACWRAWARGYRTQVAFGLFFALFGFFARSMSDNFLDGLVTTDRTRVLVWMLFGAALALQRRVRTQP